jgi:hypothetical protein
VALCDAIGKAQQQEEEVLPIVRDDMAISKKRLMAVTVVA